MSLQFIFLGIVAACSAIAVFALSRGVINQNPADITTGLALATFVVRASIKWRVLDTLQQAFLKNTNAPLPEELAAMLRSRLGKFASRMLKFLPRNSHSAENSRDVDNAISNTNENLGANDDRDSNGDESEQRPQEKEKED